MLLALTGVFYPFSYSFNLLHTHGNFHKFRDSGETIQCLREYPIDSCTPYAYPLLTMLKYNLPSPEKDKEDPPGMCSPWKKEM